MTQLSSQPEVFFEMRWNYRTLRTAFGVFACGFLGVFVLGVVVHALLYQKDLFEHYNWILALFFAAFGAFFTCISVTFTRRAVVGIEETSRIDTSGITVAKRHWRWDQMRFLRPTRESGGGINIVIALKGRADRMFWVGRPLTAGEFEQLNSRLLPFLQSHYPDLLE